MSDIKALFDDVVTDYEDDRIVGYWSQVCQKCATEHDLKNKGKLSPVSGECICGVDGCNSPAIYYFDFPQGIIPNEPQENQKESIYPSIAQLWDWLDSGVCEATDGCLVEPDGRCPHGNPSWFLATGLI